MRLGGWGSTLVAPALLSVGKIFAGGETPLQEISPLVWVLVAISAAGAFVTYAIMVYAIWRFRDPSTRRRNYG
ncbi:MAG: hypothetical protein L3K13_03690 [Thermoplasmata archaeon]|nr:hypothetical protein [Thermoplasmata archaeon]